MNHFASNSQILLRFKDHHGKDLGGLDTLGRYAAIFTWQTTFMTSCLLSPI